MDLVSAVVSEPRLPAVSFFGTSAHPARARPDLSPGSLWWSGGGGLMSNSGYSTVLDYCVKGKRRETVESLVSSLFRRKHFDLVLDAPAGSPPETTGDNDRRIIGIGKNSYVINQSH